MRRSETLWSLDLTESNVVRVVATVLVTTNVLPLIPTVRLRHASSFGDMVSRVQQGQPNRPLGVLRTTASHPSHYGVNEEITV